MKCGARVFSIDCCHLIFERSDLRLALLEAHCRPTRSCHVSCIYIGWQESAKLDTMMFTDMKRFSLRLPFWEYLDNVLTCLMGDRHKGLKAAVALCFTVALMMRAMPLMGNHASTNIEVPFLMFP